MKQDEITIKVNIADVTYPLKVALTEEENVRKAAKLINEKLKELSQEYRIGDKLNLLSMVVLEFATEVLHYHETPHIEDDGISEKLNEIRFLLKEGLELVE